MAHLEQKQFFEVLSKRFAKYFNQDAKILEIGSQNINGTVRDFFRSSKNYLGIDLGIAKDVDWIIPGELIELPDNWAEVTISTECFEHCKDWAKVFNNMMRITEPGGLLIITCASHGRATHGTLDSDEYSSPLTTSYYKNLGINDIVEEIAVGLYFSSHGFEVNSENNDLYFWGIRSNVALEGSNYKWEKAMDRLSRAQGQLAQAAERHLALQVEKSSIEDELLKNRTEVHQAKMEAQQAQAEAHQAQAEAQQAQAEAQQAQAITQQAQAEAQQAQAITQQAQAEAQQAHAEARQRTQEIKEIKGSTSWKITLPLRKLMSWLK